MEKLSFNEESLIDHYEPDFAFGYGSGVFQQEGYAEGEKPMVDLVFGVNSPTEWHERNIARNPGDYAASMRWAGPERITQLQRMGPGIFYNTFVDFQDAQLKYGVISTDDMKNDLVYWNTLYVAGRMQKPIHILKGDEDVEEAMHANYHSATNAALTLLPGKFNEREFYEAVAGLSYTGDSRMGVAENPEKVSNIVGRNMEGFRELYLDILENSRKHVIPLNGGKFEQDMDPESRADILLRLPAHLLDQIDAPGRFENPEKLAAQLRTAIGRVVAKPTRIQTVKGFVSSGPIKSARYAAAKLSKAWGR